MSHKGLSQLWKDAVTARPDPRDIVKTMHLAAIIQGTSRSSEVGIQVIQQEIGDFILFEMKGSPLQVSQVDLPTKDSEILWLCLQFHGKAVFPNGSKTTSDHFVSLITRYSDYKLTLPADRQWALFVGVTGPSMRKLLAELPQLQQAYDDGQRKMLDSVIISYSERQVLELYFKKKHGPFSALYQTGIAMVKLFGNYMTQSIKAVAQSGDVASIRLYHEVLQYIRHNYLSADLSREKIAEKLNCSVRSLTRAFERRTMSLNATILSIRLYKGRELLRQDPTLSIEQIALTLQFFDAKHFSGQYKKLFHLTPREERKIPER